MDFGKKVSNVRWNETAQNYCVAGSGRLVLNIDGRWEVGLKHRWEVGLVGGGRWTLNICGRYLI